jgi:raffinose/stachyose/melibiose transport system substrate-binding protein
MKKGIKVNILFLILTVVLISFLLFSCKAGGKVVVKTMSYGDASNPEGVSWMRIIEAFEKENPKIDIDFEMLYDEAYHQKVVARLAAGDVPDLAYMGADARWGLPWKEAGQQYDHRDIIDKNYFDLDLIPPMGPNGEIFEIPLGTSNICTVLFMNEELVKSLGFSTPKTYDDIVAMVPKAKAAGLDVISIDGADGWAWGSCFMSAVIARISGDPHWVSKATEGEFKFTDQEFVDALSIITRMVNDGVINKKAVLLDFGANLSQYSTEKALFMIQGQWIAGSIDANVADKTLMLAFPELPGEKSSTAGSVAAAIQVGYGLTKSGAESKKVREAAMKFLKFYYSEAETTQRLRDGAIVAPILKNYEVPSDMPHIIKQKVILAKSAMNTDVIDAFLSGAANDALNAGMQKICSGKATAEEVAAEVEKLWRK